jgi:hypothetical protein
MTIMNIFFSYEKIYSTLQASMDPDFRYLQQNSQPLLFKRFLEKRLLVGKDDNITQFDGNNQLAATPCDRFSKVLYTVKKAKRGAGLKHV